MTCWFSRLTPIVAADALCVLSDVREALRDDVVRGDLEPLGEPVLERDREPHRHCGSGGELLECDPEPVRADDCRVDPACDGTQLLEREPDLPPRLLEPETSVRVAVEPCLE